MKDYLVIDVHNHYIPAEVITRGGVTDGMNIANAAKSRLQAYQCIRDSECTLKTMDESGVDITVLSIPQWSSLGLDACKIINNSYREIIQRYPKRFIGCVNIPLSPEPAVIKELERGVKDLGLKAVALVTSTSTFNLGSDQLTPLFAKINELNLPIVVHPSIRQPLWGGVEYKMSQHISREYEVAKATVEVLYGWLSKYPDMKFVMPHFGGGMPSLKGRVACWFEPAGWDIPANLKGGGKTPRELEELGLDKAFEEIFGKLYFDMAGFAGWMPIVDSALKTIRTDRLCFGTDYPLDFHDQEDIRTYIENIKQLDIPEQDKRNILGENARRFFSLD